MAKPMELTLGCWYSFWSTKLWVGIPHIGRLEEIRVRGDETLCLFSKMDGPWYEVPAGFVISQAHVVQNADGSLRLRSGN
jgi:hypothetical protein